ncbi:MAG: CBS domain-containing protein [Bacillota bacterium]
MHLVKDYMMRTLNSVSTTDDVEDVIRLMHRTEMSVLPVVDCENNFLGTIYSNNILKNVLPEQYGFLETRRLLHEVNQAAENLGDIKDRDVTDYMSRKKLTVREDDKMNNVADIMLDNEESYLFVVNQREKLRGYISRADLLYYLLEVSEM